MPEFLLTRHRSAMSPRTDRATDDFYGNSHDSQETGQTSAPQHWQSRLDPIPLVSPSIPSRRVKRSVSTNAIDRDTKPGAFVPPHRVASLHQSRGPGFRSSFSNIPPAQSIDHNPGSPFSPRRSKASLARGDSFRSKNWTSPMRASPKQSLRSVLSSQAGLPLTSALEESTPYWTVLAGRTALSLLSVAIVMATIVHRTRNNFDFGGAGSSVWKNHFEKQASRRLSIFSPHGASLSGVDERKRLRRSGAVSTDASPRSNAQMPEYDSLRFALEGAELIALYFGATSSQSHENVMEMLDQRLVSSLMPLSNASAGGVALVYVSSDRYEKDMKNNFRQQWTSIPYQSPDRQNVKRHFSTCAPWEAW
jgi:Thioredoxin-like